MIVKEYVNELGCLIRVHDDCYREKSPSELSDRREEMRRVSGMILWAMAERRLAEQEQVVQAAP